MPHRASRPVPTSSRPPVEAASRARPGDTLCGYRIVRKLGEGPRAEVFLGFAESRGEHEGNVALKVARTPDDGTEAEALARAEHSHIVRLVDVSSAPQGGTCLVLERLRRDTLAHVLERRPTLGAGEVVTILAPIAAAVDVMHSSGVVHGAISAGRVLFRESGAPVLACFGRASLIEIGAPLARLAENAGVVADRRALGDLASFLLAHTVGAEDLVDWIATARESDEFGSRLAERLFAFAAGSPVRFAASASSDERVPSRVVSTARTAPRPEPGALGVPADLERLVTTTARSVAAALRKVRKPVWVAAASVLVALIAAIVVVPSDRGDAMPAPPGTPPPAPSAPSTPSGRTSDDPLVAVIDLVAGRDACVDALSALCFENVDQPGSPALEDDVELVRGIGAGGEVPADAHLATGKPALVERLGASALVDLGAGRTSKPASVLVIRTEAGWKIRDYLE